MKRILFLLFFCVAVHSLTAQRGIGTNSPNASSVLDISSTTKGFLPPRMTYAQMINIANPMAGLTVYCTDCEPVGVHYYDGSFFLNTQTRATSGELTTLDTSSIAYTYPANTTSLAPGTVYTIADGITVSIPYTGWGGNTHNSIVFNSTSGWGLKATLDPTSLTAGSGNALFNITGTIVSGHTSPLLFYINLGGKSATLSLSISLLPYGPAEVILDTQSAGNGFEALNTSNLSYFNSMFITSLGPEASLFNGSSESGAASYHADRDNTVDDWGIGYTFDNLYYFTSIRLLPRPDCCSQRTGGAVLRIYNNGVLVATSPTIAVTNGTNYTTPYSPNVIGDEVRYIFPNGGDNDNGDRSVNIVEFEITGQQVR